MSKRWNKEELNEAIEFHSTGLKWNEIADKLNRTEKSVRLKLNKLGFIQNKESNYETINCKNCGNQIEVLISENRKYCSSSCAAQVNNKKRFKKHKTSNATRERKRNCYHQIKNKKCMFCGEITTNKFCDAQCQNKFYRNEKFKLLLNGELKGTLGTICRWWKKYLIQLHGEKCMKCGWDEKHSVTGKVPIELNHIDGNSSNNKLSNLELLCPNHHSLTPNYKALNVGKGRHYRRERYKNGKSF